MKAYLAGLCICLASSAAISQANAHKLPECRILPCGPAMHHPRPGGGYCRYNDGNIDTFLGATKMYGCAEDGKESISINLAEKCRQEAQAAAFNKYGQSLDGDREAQRLERLCRARSSR